MVFFSGTGPIHNPVKTSSKVPVPVPRKVSKNSSTDRTKVDLNQKMVGQFLDASRVVLNKDKEGHYDVLGEINVLF